jgi:hypothetical protein
MAAPGVDAPAAPTSPVVDERIPQPQDQGTASHRHPLLADTRWPPPHRDRQHLNRHCRGQLPGGMPPARNRHHVRADMVDNGSSRLNVSRDLSRRGHEARPPRSRGSTPRAQRLDPYQLKTLHRSGAHQRPVMVAAWSYRGPRTPISTVPIRGVRDYCGGRLRRCSERPISNVLCPHLRGSARVGGAAHSGGGGANFGHGAGQ